MLGSNLPIPYIKRSLYRSVFSLHTRQNFLHIQLAARTLSRRAQYCFFLLLHILIRRIHKQKGSILHPNKYKQLLLLLVNTGTASIVVPKGVLPSIHRNTHKDQHSDNNACQHYSPRKLGVKRFIFFHDYDSTHMFDRRLDKKLLFIPQIFPMYIPHKLSKLLCSTTSK